MAILLISDIHSNIQALESVLRAEPEVDAVWCLGDVVGYGPNPNECIDLLRDHNAVCVAGNHDRAATGDLDTVQFNPDARAACQWTGKMLSRSSRDFLRSLQSSRLIEGTRLVHGSPRDPILEYVFNLSIAAPNFAHIDADDVCFVGHTHVPMIFSCQNFESGPPELEMSLPKQSVKFDLKGVTSIVNPGSVGQPRDGNYEAAYMIFDPKTKTVTLKRQPYDVLVTQDLMHRVGLPRGLADRLLHGR